MRSAHAWRPTKFVLGRDGLRANAAFVPYGSRLMVDLEAAAYQRVVEQHARGALVDVGCGHAPLYGVYRDRVTDVTLVDWENTVHANAGVDVVCDLNERIDCPTASADTVLATDVLEHLHRPDVLFAESARILRPGGKLLLGVPFLYWIHEQPHDYHRYTEFRLRQLCAAHRLDVCSVEAIGGAGDVLLDVSAKLVAGSPALQLLHRALSAAFRRTRRARRLREATAAQWPLAYVLVAANGAAPAWR
jgi:SAM-dependent methyltransferase